jgi:zeaxanthin glucosyltransferase
MEVEDLTVERLSGLMQSVLEDLDYRRRALYFKEVIAQTRGLDVAADVIERVFEEHQAESSANEGIELSRA